MGSLIKINDTLKISKEMGFPKELTLGKHLQDQEFHKKFIGEEFQFWNNDERLYHRPPTRVFLVEEIDGKWLYWGHALITSQTIEKEKTFGKYKITKIYDSEYQKNITLNESPQGKSYFNN